MNITANQKRFWGTIILVSLMLGGCATVPYNSSPPETTLLPQEESFIQVNANGPWRSSGVIVKTGNQYQIKASGLWRHGPWFWDRWVGPDGVGAFSGFTIIQGFTMCTLIAKIGDGSPFAVGGSLLLKPNQEGLLYFKMNRSSGEGAAQGKVDVTIKNISGDSPVPSALINKNLPSTSSGKELLKIAVWDLTPRNTPVTHAQELTSILVSEIAIIKKYEVYSQENVRTLAGWTEERMKLGCTNTQCLTALGQMDVAKLISGSVGKIGDTYSISLNLFDTQNAKAENAVSEFCASENELIGMVRKAVRNLLAVSP
jgi:hypothetical protein